MSVPKQHQHHNGHNKAYCISKNMNGIEIVFGNLKAKTYYDTCCTDNKQLKTKTRSYGSKSVCGIQIFIK